MLLDNNYNSSCKFAPDIIAYLYGETSGNEKSRFEAHLKSCNSCADELAGFSAARSSILEWRNEEFLPLATPLINIPFEKDTNIRSLAAGLNNSPSWFEQIRAFTKMSPFFARSAVGFAALLLCAGLYFMINKPFTGNGDLANGDRINKSDVAALPSPAIENRTPEISLNEIDNSNKPNISPKSVTNAKFETSKNQAAPVKTAVPNNVVKPNIARPLKQYPDSATVAVNETNKPAKIKRPTLSGNDDDDDDSLRLSDIFDDESLNNYR